MGGWERIEVRGGRGAAAEERLSDYCRIRGAESLWGRRTRRGFWLSVPPVGHRLLRPVLRGRLIDTGNAVSVRGRLRPVLWCASLLILGPIFLMLAVVPGAPHVELALAGAVFSALMGGVAWLERSEYREEADVLRATAAAIVGASSSERPRGRTTAG